MLHVVAKIKVQSGQEEEIKKTFIAALPEVEKEAGTLEYRLLQSQNDPLEFTVYEKYTDIDAFMVHGGAPYVAEMIGAWVPILDGELEITTFDEVAAKG